MRDEKVQNQARRHGAGKASPSWSVLFPLPFRRLSFGQQTGSILDRRSSARPTPLLPDLSHWFCHADQVR